MSPGKRKGRNRRGAGYSSEYGDGGYGGNNGSFQIGANPNRDRNGGGSGTGNFGGGNARQNANRGGRFGGGSEKPGGYFGFSTGPFGVMGDADTVSVSDTSSADNAAIREVQYSSFQDSQHEKLSSHPVESYAISQQIHRCDERTIEKDMKLSVNTHDTVEKYGMVPNAGLDDRMRGRSASCHIVKTSEYPSEFSGPIYKSCTMVDDDLEKTITVDQPSVRFRPCVANEQTEKLANATSLDTFQKASCEVAYPPEKSVKSTIALSSHEINGNCGRGSATDDFGMLPQRRVRSMSQRISRSSCGEGYVKADEQSVIQQFSVNAAEKEDGFPCDQEVRTVHHDENMNNCRLSKLSIHTNNDEFFFVGGHPPTDGRASLRSRRSLSRNSTSSSEFLPSYVDAHNNQSSGIPVADNGQCSNVRDIEKEASPYFSRLSTASLHSSDAQLIQPLHHISVHSVASSGHPNTPVTSNLDSFGAEPERRENSCSQNNTRSTAHSILSKDPSDSSRLSTANLRSSGTKLDSTHCSSSHHNTSSGIFAVKHESSPYSSRLSIASLPTSDAQLNNNLQCTNVHSIPSKDHPSSSILTTANLNSSGAEVNDLQNASSQLNIRSSGHSVGTGDRPYSATLSTAKLCSCGAKLDNLHNASSQHNTCSSVYDVEDETPPSSPQLSTASLRTSDPEVNHSLHRTSTHSIASKHYSHSSTLSTANLHSSVANLDHQLEATKAKTSSCSTQLSTASLHTSDEDVNHSSHAFSLHKAFSSGHSIRSKDTQNSSRLSTANLCSSGGELDNKHSASSQQNICSNDQSVGSEDVLSSSRLSAANLNSSRVALEHSHKTSSQHSIHSNSHSIASEDHSHSSRLSVANLYSCGAELEHSRNTSSQYNICSSIYGVEETPYSSRLSTASLPTSDAQVDHNLYRTSVHSIPSKDHPNSSRLSTANLSSSGAQLNDVQNVSAKHNMRSSSHSLGSGDHPSSTRLSAANLYSSDAKVDNLHNASSQHNTRSSSRSIGSEDRPNSARLSTANSYSSDAKLDSLHNASFRHNTSLSVYGAEDEAPSYPSRLSTASLHASDAEVNHPPHMSSRRSSYSSVKSIPCKDARDSEKLSAANSSCGALDCLHTASSQHNTCSSVYGGEEEVPPNFSRLSAASLHASDAEVNHPLHMSSRHSSYSSVHSIPCKDARDSEKSSAANTRSSCGALNCLHTASSQHNTCSSVYGGEDEAPSYPSRISTASLHAFDAEVDHPPHMSSLHSSYSSVHSIPCKDARDTEKSSAANIHSSCGAMDRLHTASSQHSTCSSVYGGEEKVPPNSSKLSATNLHTCVSKCSNVQDIEKEAPPNLSKLSGVSLLTTGTEFDRSLQASRQHSTYSSAQNIPSNEVMDSASLSTTDFHSSDTQSASARSIASSKHANPSMRSRTNSYSTGVEHNRQRDASSQHNICSSVHNNTSKNPPIYSSLNICGSASEPDCLNNCLSVYGVEERAPAYSSKLSTTSLRVSDAEVNHPVHTNSRHSSSANVHSVTVEARPDSSRLSTAVLHSSDAKGDYQLHSQNNNCPSVLDIEVKAASCSSKLSTASLCPSDRNVHHSSHISSCSSVHSTVSKERSNSSNLSIEKSHSHGAELDHLHNRSSSHSIASKDLPNDSRLSTASLYGSGAELDHQRNVSSQQNICSSVYGADQEAPAYSSRLSTASMPISDAKMKQPLLTSAQHSIRTSALSIASGDHLNSSKLSRASLYSSRIGLDQQHYASSQQNICSSVHSIPCKDPSNSLRESAANLYNSGGESDHQRNASSQQNIGSSVHSIACKGPLSSLRQSAVDLPSTNLEPGLETHARSEQNICLSVDSTACHDSQNSVKSFTLSRRPSYLKENKNVKAPPPSPVVGHSFGTAPDSISRPPSRISLHGFETNNGGLWYHFSDSERSRDSASNKLTLSQTPTKSAKSSLKPLRSRSSTTSVRNEVNFASIPQLYSHPNDRFDVDSGGEPFRPTSEHKFTPHVPKSESRLRLLSETTNVDGNKAPHTNSVDVDTQLLSVPIESNSGEKCGNTFVQQSETPLVRGLEIVPPALFVTDALTPNRAVSDLDDNCDFNSPASFNRTHFSREMYQRRWITEPHQCEVGIQTGETIRLRQKMFDSEEQPCGPDKIVEQGAKPDQPRGSPSYRQFASSPFEKRGHPAPVVLNTMLQNRQRLMERNTSEDFRVLEKTSPLAYRTDHKTEVEQQQHHVQKRQPPVDNYHQYETRTHQKWTSNTRSHWEGRKLDENFNELRSDNRNEMEKHCGTGGPTGVPESGEQYSGSSHRVEVSEKPFEERETIVERCERYEEKTVHLDSTVHPWKRNILSEQQMDATRKLEKPSHKVDGTSGATGSDQPIVIPKEAVKQLRQEVMDESRQPATPKSSRVRCFNIQQPSTGQEKPLAAPQIKTFSLSSNNEVLSPTSQYRISIKHALSPFGPTSRKHEGYGFNNEGSDQTSYKWKVADIDTKKQYKEPDARSSDARSGRSGSTVRRHIPRGRIRDLAALFNKMSREAERETTTARGKSLPPPKKHSKIVRTNSVRRPPDSPVRINILNEESERLLGQLESRLEPSMKELPSAAQDIVNENLMSNSPCHLVSSEKDNYRDTQAPPFHPLNWANLQPAGGEVVRVVANEEVESTDSRIELRRTSTPLENRGNGDLANVFCGVPSIPSPNNSATIATKCPRSEFNGNFHFSEQNRREDIHTQKLMNSILHETDGHCGQTVEVRASPPPQRLSLMHPNSSQSGYYSQGKQPSSGQQYRSVESCPPPSTCTRTCAPHFPNTEQERVDGEIDRMFEFVDEHDGISTIGRESLSERKISVLKHDEYGSVQGDGVGHLPELPPRPPQPPMSYSIYSPKQPGYNSAFKYSMSQYRDVQRLQHMGRTSVDLPARFSSPTAPTAGIGVSTYKSREGTIGEKVNIFNNVSRSPYTHPSALATSTPVDSPQGTACSQQARDTAIPNLEDSFVSSITAASNLPDIHEEYKRQIAKLSNQIHVQEEQIEMTIKVLALARKKQTSMQELSAQRTLLLAHERLDLLRCEMNRISALAAVRNPPPPVCRELRGTMTISNITIHLNRNFCQKQLDHDCSYALLILLKCGTEVEATGPISLMTYHQGRVRQLTFTEHVQFSNLPVDFNVIVEVYAMKLPTSRNGEHSCASSIASRCRNLLPGASHRPTYLPYGNDAQISEFFRCGYVVLNRDTVGINKFYLDEAEYPLEGTIEVLARCTTLPPAIEVDNRGFLTMYQTISGMASWERYWAVLRRGMVYFWRYPDDESLDKRPIACIDLSKCTNDMVAACSVEQCPRENSFSIDMLVSTTPSIMEKKRVLLSADSGELMEAWLQALNETLSVLRG